MKNIYIYYKENQESINIKDKLKALLLDEGFNIQDDVQEDTELIISLGGDGSFLRAAKKANNQVPVLGVNTGHLGFYSDFDPNKLEEIIDCIKSQTFVLQKYKTIKTIVKSSGTECALDSAINDVLIEHSKTGIVHLDLYIENDLVENFTGNGIVVSSSAGSTGYNYSLGASVVDPDINLLQITPVAPTNNVAYRSLTSSLIIPDNKKIKVVCQDENDISIVIDGKQVEVSGIKEVYIELSNEEINVVRKKDYSFWTKVKTKFIK